MESGNTTTVTVLTVVLLVCGVATVTATASASGLPPIEQCAPEPPPGQDANLNATALADCRCLMGLVSRAESTGVDPIRFLQHLGYMRRRAILTQLTTLLDVDLSPQVLVALAQVVVTAKSSGRPAADHETWSAVRRHDPASSTPDRRSAPPLRVRYPAATPATTASAATLNFPFESRLSPPQAASGSTNDRLALLALSASTDVVHRVRGGWGSNTTVCNWTGVTCTAGRVVEL
jgi:hypothetical protein